MPALHTAEHTESKLILLTAGLAASALAPLSTAALGAMRQQVEGVLATISEGEAHLAAQAC